MVIDGVVVESVEQYPLDLATPGSNLVMDVFIFVLVSAAVNLSFGQY